MCQSQRAPCTKVHDFSTNHDFQTGDRIASLHASSLQWRGLTSPARPSSATAPRLPDADHRASGRVGDLPVPAQGASVHARVSDHAGSTGHSRSRVRPYCLPRHLQRRHPGLNHFRGSMAGLYAPLPTLRRHPRGCQRTARGQCGSLLLHYDGLSPSTPCRSPGAQVFDFHAMKCLGFC